MSKLTGQLVNRIKKAGHNVKLTSDNQRFYLWLGNEIVCMRDKK